MFLFLLICQWRVCKIVCNFAHYFGGRSKRESSRPEKRSSARFLREIWISYFARRILEGVFVGGIVNIRNECLFFSVHGKWIGVRNKQIAWTAIFFSRFMGNESQCGTNKSHENRFAVHAICLFHTSRFTRFVCSALRFISHEPRKKDTHSLRKLLFQYIHVFTLVLHAAG